MFVGYGILDGLPKGGDGGFGVVDVDRYNHCAGFVLEGVYPASVYSSFQHLALGCLGGCDSRVLGKIE